jgi:hypothetical protein
VFGKKKKKKKKKKKNYFLKGEREKKYINLIFFFLVVKGTLSLETSNVSLETKQKNPHHKLLLGLVCGTTTKMRSTQSSHSVFMFSDCVDLILCLCERERLGSRLFANSRLFF